MLHNSHQLQFFMSTDAECPYLPGRRERKIFSSLMHSNAEPVQNALSLQGFRRSQNIIYRPVCHDCAACLSARIPLKAFKASKNLRRLRNKNTDIVREVHQARATDEQYDLFERYVNSRHKDGGMSDMSLFDFSAMINETTVPTRIVEYRMMRDGRPSELVGVALTDVLNDGLSMVYSFFDPELSDRSLGTYIILDHIAIGLQSGLSNLYLGYWVKGSNNMGYKARFRPLEVFYNGLWTRIEKIGDAEPEVPSSQRVLLKALRTLSRIDKPLE